MKLKSLTVLTLVCTTIISCKTNHPEGIYTCEKSNKENTIEKQGNMDVVKVDFDCIYSKFNFKDNNKVVVVVSDGVEFSATYEMENEKVRIKTEKIDIVLQMQDKNTLSGEGYAKGLYKK